MNAGLGAVDGHLDVLAEVATALHLALASRSPCPPFPIGRSKSIDRSDLACDRDSMATMARRATKRTATRVRLL